MHQNFEIDIKLFSNSVVKKMIKEIMIKNSQNGYIALCDILKNIC